MRTASDLSRPRATGARFPFAFRFGPSGSRDDEDPVPLLCPLRPARREHERRKLDRTERHELERRPATSQRADPRLALVLEYPDQHTARSPPLATGSKRTRAPSPTASPRQSTCQRTRASSSTVKRCPSLVVRRMPTTRPSRGPSGPRRSRAGPSREAPPRLALRPGACADRGFEPDFGLAFPAAVGLRFDGPRERPPGSPRRPPAPFFLTKHHLIESTISGLTVPHDHRTLPPAARVAELVDALDSESSVCKDVLVRLQSRAPFCRALRFVFRRVLRAAHGLSIASLPSRRFRSTRASSARREVSGACGVRHVDG